MNVLGFPRAFRASDPEPMNEVRILVRLGNLTSLNSEINGGRPACYYVMDIDHVSPIACTHFIIIATEDRSRRLPAFFEIMQSSRRPRKITRPQSAGPLTPSLKRVSIPSGQTFRAWNLSGPTDHSIGPTCHRAHRDQVIFHCRHSTLFGVPPSKKSSSDPIVTSFPEYPD